MAPVHGSGKMAVTVATECVAPPPIRSSTLQKAGAWLFRHRGATAVPFAILAVWGARPSGPGLLVGSLLLIAGEGLRLSAVRCIGPHARGLKLRAPRLVTWGPYSRLRHPLYAGNALLCLGLILLSNAYLPWLPLVWAIAFAIQYTVFVRREETFLDETWGEAWRTYSRQVPAFGWSRRRVVEQTLPPILSWRETLRLEWPTLRTVVGLSLLVLIRGWLR